MLPQLNQVLVKEQGPLGISKGVLGGELGKGGISGISTGVPKG
jgi:hypothetical protein